MFLVQNLQDSKHIHAITFAFEVSYNMPSLDEVPPHWLHEIYWLNRIFLVVQILVDGVLVLVYDLW